MVNINHSQMHHSLKDTLKTREMVLLIKPIPQLHKDPTSRRHITHKEV